MPEYRWPDTQERSLIGTKISRIDGPAKSSGRAKYSYDIVRPNMLIAKILSCPYAHCKITRLDMSAAEKVPGVRAVKQHAQVGSELKWAGAEIAAVAAETEEQAGDGLRAIQVEYERLPHNVEDRERDKVPAEYIKAADAVVVGNPDQAFGEADVVVEGNYGAEVMEHCCLETHGQVCEWDAEKKNLTVWASTQAVASIGPQYAEHLKIPPANVQVITQHMGGGFGSKFAADVWGFLCADLAHMTGRPVKLMLDRDQELMVAGTRPSAFAKVKVGGKKDGSLTVWSSQSWGSGGPQGSGSPPIPYVFKAPGAPGIPHSRHQHFGISTNVGASRAWRAPNHPQACLITMCALEDLAAAMNLDPMQFFRKNIRQVGERAPIYLQEMDEAERLSDWKKLWHPRGDKTAGPRKRGLGMGIHTWGGKGHASNCELLINPDGSVEVKMATQDLGVGTRTVLALVVGDTLGLPVDAVKITIGDSRLPRSGSSGGSTTVGGVSSAARRAAQDAREAIFAKVAPVLGAGPADLQARNGRISVKGNASKSLSWKEATAKLGVTPSSFMGVNQQTSRDLNSAGAAGVQVADVTVDVDTGIVKVNRFAAVQDCGLVLNLKTAESQVYGAVIMGIAYSLFEEKISDPHSGRMLNANMEFYRLAGIADIGEIVVKMMTGAGYDEKGVIGLGEPPVIAPGAAISNAVANAIGVRVADIPLTPDRVLAALEKKGGKA